jgi:uncharacterized protein (TIGR03437 family)
MLALFAPAAIAQSDTKAPQLISFSIGPTTVDVSSGPATLTVRVVATDDLSGFGSGSTGNGSIDIRHTSGASPFGRGSLPMTGGTTLNPVFDFTLTVPQFSQAGTYPINLTLIDNVFNTARFAPADLQARGFPSTITVTSNPDTRPPELVSFSISPTTVDVSAGPAILTVHIVATDNLSGFGSGSTGSGSIDIRHTSGASPFGRGSLPITGGTALNAIFDFTLTVPQFSPLGSYPINLTLIDNVFNTARFTPADLQARGFPSTITVATLPSLQLGTNSINFTYQSGSPAPQAQAVSVSASSATAFTVTVSGGSWLSVNLNAGATPANLSVSVTPTDLNPGTYNGTISIAAPGASNSPRTVAVTLTVTSAPSFTTAGIANAANYLSGRVSPGEIIVIFGRDFGPASTVGLQVTNGMVATEIAETRVLFDGVAAPMVYAVNGQISCVVPYEVAGKSTTQVVIEYKKVRGAAATVPVVEAVPAIFSLTQSGTGQGAILNPDFSVNGASNPAPSGSVVMVYATGEGRTDTPVSGSVIPLAGPYPRPVLSGWSATVGGKDSRVLYAGSAPGSVAGVFQVNLEIPSNLPAGNHELIIKAGSFTSQSGLTVAVK